MTPRSQKPVARRVREQALSGLATRQHGVASRSQLRSLGFGEEAIKAALAEGRLGPLHEEVFAVGHRRVSRRGYWWAGVLAYGPGTVLSHQSAAVLWGLRRRRKGPIHVTARRGRQGIRRREGIWIHRCKLRSEEATTREEIPVTTVARTLFDLAEVAPYEEMKRTAEAADRRNLLQLRELEEVCERGRGRRALRPVRRLLIELGVPAEGRSPLEIRFAEFLRDHRIPAPAQNVLVLGHEVDALWPAAKLVIELDSWEHHGDRAAFERDRARDPKLLLAGYRTIRVTHRRLDDEPEQLAAEIRALLAQSWASGDYSERSVSTAICAVSVGLSPTRTPFASSASFFAWAVPEEPEMIAPAWPICLPGGAVKPAM
jgi:very-short-patch-repair endonuclease